MTVRRGGGVADNVNQYSVNGLNKTDCDEDYRTGLDTVGSS